MRIYFSLLAITLIVSCNNRPKAKDYNYIFENAKEAMDSLNARQNRKFYPQVYADSLLQIDLSSATLIKIDSLIDLYPRTYYLFINRGDWFLKNMKLDSAMLEYQRAAMMAYGDFPLSLDRKASVYIEWGKLDSAIDCYKKAAAMNFDFNYDLASTYELDKKKDSAIKYYLLYLGDYPERDDVQKHVNYLKLGKK